MIDRPDTTADRFSGFSSNELLRRARVLRDVAEKEPMRERRNLERLALDHEDAARRMRSGSLAEQFARGEVDEIEVQG